MDREVAVTRSEEELVVGTRQVAVESVKVRKVIVEEEVTLTVTLRREELRVEHGPPSPDADPDVDEVELVLRREEPVVDLVRVPYERVRVVRGAVTEERVIEEQLRREEIDVREEPAAP